MRNKIDLIAVNYRAESEKKLPSNVSGSALIQKMKDFPFYGFIEINLPGTKSSFLMFSSNDCAVS